MKLAIIGSRSVDPSHAEWLYAEVPAECTGFVSGGAYGADQLAVLASRHFGLPCQEFLPDYSCYLKGAPLKRNLEIVDAADLVFAVWDGESRGTMHAMHYCMQTGKPLRIFHSDGTPFSPAETDAVFA